MVFKNIIIQLYTDINRKLSADWNSLLTGFYSKDVILELAGARYSLSVHFSYLLASFSVLTTSYYSWRLIWFCFHTNQNKFQLGRLSNTQKQTIQHAHDADWVGIATNYLSIRVNLRWVLFKSMFIGLGTDFGIMLFM
jgi:NADH-ubiquinone oxidoreductase chain 5